MIRYNYKDTVFRSLFGSEKYKQNALDLYNAINETNYTDLKDLVLTTISDVIYMGIKNDVSFIIGNEMNLWEAQSSYNPNMPLRGLDYFARLFSKYTKEQNAYLYGSSRLKLPTPVYIVFYNGKQERPEKEVLCLSDSFDKPELASIEVTATVLNINYGKNHKIMEQCMALNGYAQLIAKIREYEGTYNTETAVDFAINYCLKHNLLKDFLEGHKAEVKDMIMTSTTFEEAMEMLGHESKEEGRAEGRAEGQALFAKLVSQLLSEGKTEELMQVSQDKEKREEYLKLYGIID